jgi:hypothetical protein
MAAPKLDDKGGSAGVGSLPREGLISVLTGLRDSLLAEIEPKLQQIRAIEQVMQQEQDQLKVERFKSFSAQQR